MALRWEIGSMNPILNILPSVSRPRGAGMRLPDNGPLQCAHVCGFWGNPPHPGPVHARYCTCPATSRSTSARHQVDPSSKRLIAVSVHFFCRGMQIPCLRTGLIPDTGEFESQFRPIAVIFLIDMAIQKPVCSLPSAVHLYTPELSIRPSLYLLRIAAAPTKKKKTS